MSPPDSTKFKFEDAAVLLAMNGDAELDILSRILLGFRIRSPKRCATGAEAQEALAAEPYDLVISDMTLPDMSGPELVRWLRCSELEPNRFVATLIVSGHAREKIVFQARDSGTNFILTKPITPRVLFDRIIWVAKETRAFVETEAYVGPDRRFQNFGPPPGVAGRRRGDLSANVGLATEPNLSQAANDALLIPVKRAG